MFLTALASAITAIRDRRHLRGVSMTMTAVPEFRAEQRYLRDFPPRRQCSRSTETPARKTTIGPVTPHNPIIVAHAAQPWRRSEGSSITLPRLGLRLTPREHLLLDPAEDAPLVDEAVAKRLAEAFGRSTGHGLVQFGAGKVGHDLPPVFVWWHAFAARHVGALCLHAPGAVSEAASSPVLPVVPPPGDAEIASLALTAPMMPARNI